MGFIALHSSHYSKVFKRLMGTSCSLTWREAGEKERLWVCNPAHPIARGIDRYFEIENTEMYGEPFAIPTPDEIVFISWFEGGEVFRSGCTWKRGNGKIFYFRPGHEAYPIYFQSKCATGSAKCGAIGPLLIPSVGSIAAHKFQYQAARAAQTKRSAYAQRRRRRKRYKMSKFQNVPTRAEIPESDKWDLTHLFADVSKWQEDFAWVQQTYPRLTEWKGKLGKSAQESGRSVLSLKRRSI